MTRCVACGTEAVEGSFCRVCGAPLPAPWPRPGAPAAQRPAPIPPTGAPLGAASPAVPVTVSEAALSSRESDRYRGVMVAGAVLVLVLVLAGIAAAIF